MGVPALFLLNKVNLGQFVKLIGCSNLECDLAFFKKKCILRARITMEDLVLTIPTQDLGIMETLATRMGWTVRSKRSIVQKFVDSCPKTPMMSDEEIAAEVNAVRYGK